MHNSRQRRQSDIRANLEIVGSSMAAAFMAMERGDILEAHDHQHVAACARRNLKELGVAPGVISYAMREAMLHDLHTVEKQEAIHPVYNLPLFVDLFPQEGVAA